MIFRFWNKLNIITRILIGLVLGALLGLYCTNSAIGLLGTLFTSSLQAIAPFLVFTIVLSTLAQHQKGRAHNMGYVIFLYILGTLCSALLSVLMSYAFPIVLPLSQEFVTNSAIETLVPLALGDMIKTLFSNMTQNPVIAFSQGNYIGILCWAIAFGIALRHASDQTKDMLGHVSDAMTRVVRWIIQLAPFGIMGLVYTAVSTNGVAIFSIYGKLLALLVGTMLMVLLIINPLIVLIFTRRNPYPLVWSCMKGSFITAFLTRSSAANIPVNLQLCKSLELKEENYALSIPLGATINMSGAAITITIMTLAAVHTQQMSIDITTACLLSVVASISACGASGVAGGSLLLIPMACSLFGIPSELAMQVVGIGFIVGVVQDSFETGLNSSTDVLFTACAQHWQSRKEESKA